MLYSADGFSSSNVPVAGNSGSNFASKFSNAFGEVGQVNSSQYLSTGSSASPVIGVSSVEGDGVDPTGYEQAQWEYERQLELLAEQRAYNSAEAQKNRDWQERMSNTAYQRAVQDLDAAGLNKWLALTGGNGASASTPSGSSATSSAGDASVPNPIIYKALIQFSQAILTGAMKLIDFF